MDITGLQEVALSGEGVPADQRSGLRALRHQSARRQEGARAGPAGQAAAAGQLRDVFRVHRHVLEDSTGSEFCRPCRFAQHEPDAVLPGEQHFDYLRELNFCPRLLESKQERHDLRIRAWSAGCSSGEEPYSIAIALLEAIAGQGRWDVKLLATDISTRILEQARNGLYDTRARGAASADAAGQVPDRATAEGADVLRGLGPPAQRR